MVRYLHLRPGDALPALHGGLRFRAVVVIEDEVDADWQAVVSDWLVVSGCRYMMAWGRRCSSWEDSVDFANLRMFDCGDIPDDGFVMTTRHDNEPLADVFWFAAHSANHPHIDLDDIYIVHIAPAAAEAEMTAAFRMGANRPH